MKPFIVSNGPIICGIRFAKIFNGANRLVTNKLTLSNLRNFLFCTEMSWHNEFKLSKFKGTYVRQNCTNQLKVKPIHCCHGNPFVCDSSILNIC